MLIASLLCKFREVATLITLVFVSTNTHAQEVEFSPPLNTQLGWGVSAGYFDLGGVSAEVSIGTDIAKVTNLEFHLGTLGLANWLRLDNEWFLGNYLMLGHEISQLFVLAKPIAADYSLDIGTNIVSDHVYSLSIRVYYTVWQSPVSNTDITFTQNRKQRFSTSIQILIPLTKNDFSN